MPDLVHRDLREGLADERRGGICGEGREGGGDGPVGAGGAAGAEERGGQRARGVVTVPVEALGGAPRVTENPPVARGGPAAGTRGRRAAAALRLLGLLLLLVVVVAVAIAVAVAAVIVVATAAGPLPRAPLRLRGRRKRPHKIPHPRLRKDNVRVQDLPAPRVDGRRTDGVNALQRRGPRDAGIAHVRRVVVQRPVRVARSPGADGPGRPPGLAERGIPRLDAVSEALLPFGGDARVEVVHDGLRGDAAGGRAGHGTRPRRGRGRAVGSRDLQPPALREAHLPGAIKRRQAAALERQRRRLQPESLSQPPNCDALAEWGEAQESRG